MIDTGSCSWFRFVHVFFKIIIVIEYMSIKHNTDYREDNQQDSQIKVFVRVRPFRNELSRRCLKVV
jgi:hypothetical protein